MAMSGLLRFTGWRASATPVDRETAAELRSIEAMLSNPSDVSSALRMLRKLVIADPQLKRGWELGVRAFDTIRYDYTPSASVRASLAVARQALLAGDRAAAL